MPNRSESNEQLLVVEVERALRWEVRLGDLALRVDAREGLVRLSGVVECWALRVAAEATARQVRGVREVVNDVVVSPPANLRRTDAELARIVAQTLEWDAFVPHTAINVSVEDAVVLLEGEVERVSERDELDRAVRHLAGVVSVVNHVLVSAPARIDLPGLRQSIAAARARAGLLTRPAIELHSFGRSVILSGPVGSPEERELVLAAVRGAPGVGAVEDHLQLVSA